MIYISSQPPFLCRYFCKWPQALHLHCHLERSWLSVSGKMVLCSMKTLSREISPLPWSLLTSEWDFSTLQRFRGNDKKTGRAAVSIGSLSMKDEASAVWSFNHLKGTPSFFFTAPAYWGKGAAILWDLWIRAAEQPCNLKSAILTQLKVKLIF